MALSKLSKAAADHWIQRWDHQQQRYAIDREERFTVIADIVEHITAAQGRPLVVDLGCGPGSLTARLAARLPDAEIVAVDMDPLLLELARTRHPGAARYVQAVIGTEGWTDLLGFDRPLDAAVSTTTLHCLPEPGLRAVYRELAALLRPGDVLVNADHLPLGTPALARIATQVGTCRAERLRAHRHEDWDAWWAAAADAPELSALQDARCRHDHATTPNNHLSLGRHLTHLHDAGFREAAPVWQFGASHVLTAVR
ncbi:class I SAM-dependent methyltransferase [Streptomyces sp. HYC2]|uniref:class I SAM-dependent methyltransferase n=1 Tax=Streptomyces sp. HYC2 TaxID=2955207 RepID=UPI0024804F0D|nr:class I SAM-dependent methyltransferase [Streptomyces sp. HYC2]